MHPNNYKLVTQQKKELDLFVDRDIKVSVYINETLTENSCLIEHQFGQLDASIDTQLHEIRKVLQEINVENHDK